MYIQIYVCMHTCTHMYIRIYTHICKYMYIYVHTHILSIHSVAAPLHLTLTPPACCRSSPLSPSLSFRTRSSPSCNYSSVFQQHPSFFLQPPLYFHPLPSSLKRPCFPPSSAPPSLTLLHSPNLCFPAAPLASCKQFSASLPLFLTRICFSMATSTLSLLPKKTSCLKAHWDLQGPERIVPSPYPHASLILLASLCSPSLIPAGLSMLSLVMQVQTRMLYCLCISGAFLRSSTELFCPVPLAARLVCTVI